MKFLIIFIFFPLVVVVDVVKKNHAKNNIINLIFGLYTIKMKCGLYMSEIQAFLRFQDGKPD